MPSDQKQLTNATVAAAVGVFHRESAQSSRPMMPGEVETPPNPTTVGFTEGPLSITQANEIGAQLAAEMNVQTPIELAAACGVSNHPTEAAYAAIEKILNARLTEAATGKNADRHAQWFVERHMNAFKAAVRAVLGDDVGVHFGKQGMPVLIRRAVA